MPNVLIIGFCPKKAESLRDQIDGHMIAMGHAHDACTTIVYADTRWCSKHEASPYVLVRNTRLAVAKKIAKTLHRWFDGKIDIEYEKIGGFLAATT